jgi:hypothetical protein
MVQVVVLFKKIPLFLTINLNTKQKWKNKVITGGPGFIGSCIGDVSLKKYPESYI